MLNKLSTRFIYFFAIAVFSVGLLTTYEWIKYNEQKQLELLDSKFNQYASNSYVSIQQALLREIDRLSNLAALFKLTGNVQQHDFERFAKVLLASSAQVQSFQWIEVVKDKQRERFEENMRTLYGANFQIQSQVKKRMEVASKRDNYAVIKFAYPLEKNSDYIGLDIYSMESQKDAAYIADITQSPISSEPYYPPNDKSHQQTFNVYQPVYGFHGDLKGYAVLLLSINDFVDSVKNKTLMEKSLGLMIVDSVAHTSLYVAPASLAANVEYYRSHKFYLPFSGRSLLLTIDANLTQLPEFSKSLEGRIYKIWSTGFIVSFLLALIAFFALRYRLQVNQAKKTILENEKNYRELINQSSEGFILLDSDGDILDVNAEICDMLGYSRHELLIKNACEFDVEHSLLDVKKICGELQCGDKLLFESTYQKKNGTRLKVEVSASKFNMNGKSVIGSFTRDLTERLTNRELSVDNKVMQLSIEQYTKDLRDQKQTFEELFEKSADGIFITSGRHVLDCNQAIVDMFGYSSKEEILHQPNKVFAPTYQPDGEKSHRKGFRMLQICLQRGQHRYEWVNKRANGTEFWTDVVLTRIEYFGKPVVHVALRDISERKRFELQMNSAREEAIYANKVKSEFLAKMSHEIRTPLHGILNYAQLGGTRISTANQDKLSRYFDHIKVSGERLLVLFNDLLDSAKLESGSMTYNFKYQNIQPTIESCVAEQHAAIHNKNIQLEIMSADYMAYFDQHRIAQVVSNLLNNAIRYTPEHKKIVISIDTQAVNYIVISVQDSGVGVSIDEVETIFDSFVQSKDTDLNTGGSGLGLAICKEIVQAHQGRIWIENWASQDKIEGSIFKFSLPLTNDRNSYGS